MRNISLVIFGVGGVGRTLIKQLVQTKEIVANRNHCQFDVVAFLDSRNWIWQPAGIGDEELLKAVADKQEGRLIGEERPNNLEALEVISSTEMEDVILVDVTAASDMEQTIDRALELHYGVVMANKKPLAGPWSTAWRYYNHPLMRYESTVGGGQPLVATLRYLNDVGDPISLIEGQLSGTLGYICSRLDDDTPFSMALAEAKAKGYTEPDPREDLGGLDVMRKILILGRLAGWELEEDDIKVEALYHRSLSHLSIREFMEAAIAMDPSIRDQVVAARADGYSLRYVARVDQGGGSVGLKRIPQNSPLANLKYVSFKTKYYDEEPLMIGGKGAGVDMTAAGVLGDLIGLQREMALK